MNKSKVVDAIEYTAEGAVVKDELVSQRPTGSSLKRGELKKTNKHRRTFGPRHRVPRRERNILLPSPKIYVNDGSNGTNLINTYSYKNYCERGETPSIKNNYANNYKTTLTSNPVYDAVDGLRLHPTAESGGYSNFTTVQYIK